MEALCDPKTVILFAARERAREYYSDLAYHNFEGHIESTLQEAARIIETLKQKNVEIDYFVVALAILFHDTDFHLDHEVLGFETKEELSAHIAVVELQKLGLDENIINRVADCIRATYAKTEPSNNEEALVRFADVGNVYGSLWEFTRNGFLLAKEAGQRGLTLPDTYQAYCSNTASFLQYYFGSPPIFTDKDGDVVALENYRVNAERNLERLQRVGKLPLRLVQRAVPTVAQLAPQNWFEK